MGYQTARALTMLSMCQIHRAEIKIMKRLRYAILLSLIAGSIWGQAIAKANPEALPNRPEALVNSLYGQVVVRHPIGVPFGPDMAVFGPYLSKALLNRFDLNNGCFADWYRQHPEPNLKPAIGIFEDGVFSGGDEKAEPTSFHVERTESGNDGSSRVYVRLALDNPPNDPWIWYVAAVVIYENGRPVVDDVLYLENEQGDIESRLSEALSSRCNGAHWVGNGG